MYHLLPLIVVSRLITVTLEYIKTLFSQANAYQTVSAQLYTRGIDICASGPFFTVEVMSICCVNLHKNKGV